MVLHGSEIYQKWLQAGGTLDSWSEHVVPILIKAGTGPLYKVSQEQLNDILAKAKGV